MLKKVVINVKKDKKLYIKDVAKITGLSEQLIRKWESRYQVVKPKRLSNGYRVYSTDDLNTLQELKKLRDQNISMQKAVQIVLDSKELSNLTEVLAEIDHSPYVEQLIKKGTTYDEAGITFVLTQAHHHYGLEVFLQNTVRPFLKGIGNLWESKTWDESQESMSSLAVRDYLTEIDRHFKIKDNAPIAVGFCLPGELHEIPLQILLLQMKMRGWRTTRIGASPKFTAIERLINHIEPDKVLLSASTLIPFQKAESLLHDLDRIAEKHPKIDFYIGGPGAWEYTNVVKPNHIRVGFSVDDMIFKKTSL